MVAASSSLYGMCSPGPDVVKAYQNEAWHESRRKNEGPEPTPPGGPRDLGEHKVARLPRRLDILTRPTPSQQMVRTIKIEAS